MSHKVLTFVAALAEYADVLPASVCELTEWVHVRLAPLASDGALTAMVNKGRV